MGEAQSGVDKHLETKVLDTGSMKDERLSRVGLYYYVKYDPTVQYKRSNEPRQRIIVVP